MQKSLLSYSKTIIEKVSFDKHLLTKEYNKALAQLSSVEKEDLEIWFRQELLKTNGYLQEELLEQEV